MDKAASSSSIELSAVLCYNFKSSHILVTRFKGGITKRVRFGLTGKVDKRRGIMECLNL